MSESGSLAATLRVSGSLRVGARLPLRLAASAARRRGTAIARSESDSESTAGPPSRGYSGCAQAASKDSEQAPAHAAIGTLKLRCQPATCQWAASLAGSDSESVNALTAGSLPLAPAHTTLTGNGDGGQGLLVGLPVLSGSRPGLSDIITMLAVFARRYAEGRRWLAFPQTAVPGCTEQDAQWLISLPAPANSPLPSLP